MSQSIKTVILILFLSPFISFGQSSNTDCPPSELNCQGTKKFEDGRTYTGTFRLGEPNGSGKMVWTDGTRFEGEWKDGEMKNGAMLFTNGDEYLGEFSGGTMNGKGSVIKANGDSFTGEWKDGLETGPGTLTRIDGSKFHGTFKDGKRFGNGQLAWESGDTLSGIWIDNKLEGVATTKFQNGDKLVNNWREGRMKVNGKYIFADGRELAGSMTTIYYITTLEDEFDDEAIENNKNNLELAWYTFGMEFRASEDYDLASDFLAAAQKYGSPSSDNSAMIAMGLEIIKKEQKDKGWAKLPKKN